MKLGYLLLNLGTPDDPSPPAVKRYLKQFLMDGYVIDLPWLVRFALVHGIILNTRPKKSAEAYEKVWTERGSPLLYHSRDLVEKVRARAGGVPVALGMRYGKPSIEQGLLELLGAGVTDIRAIPLYPQYSLAATESSIAETRRELRRLSAHARVHFVRDFFVHPGTVAAYAQSLKTVIQDFKPDHVIFSFHGLPERQVKRTDPTGLHCLAGGACCDLPIAEGTPNRSCYRAQSYATARAIAKSVGLAREGYSVGFQSRLGGTPWIKPYTDVLYDELAERGVKRVAVSCPSFVADCLETLEEVAMRGREQFMEAGGEDLRLVPSLNSEDAFADAVLDLLGHGRENL